MPVPKSRRKLLSLPSSLLKELGLPAQQQSRPGERPWQQQQSRKDRRRVERAGKKIHRNGPIKTRQERDGHLHRAGWQRPEEPRAAERREDSESEEFEGFEDDGDSRDGNDQSDEYGSNPEPKPANTTASRAAKSKLSAHDKEIALLEKKLGIKGRKQLPKSFYEDGLLDLLGDLDGLDGGSDLDDYSGSKHKTESEAWLAAKRRNATGVEPSSDEDEVDEEGDEDDEDNDGKTDDDSGESGADSPPDSESERSASDPEPALGKKRKSQPNPLLPPPRKGQSQQRVKYVPPSRRPLSAPDQGKESALRRQIDGFINKLSEARLLATLDDVEKLYTDEPPSLVTSVLFELLLFRICDPFPLTDTMLILLSGFITGIYKIIGPEFGGRFLQRLIESYRLNHDAAVLANEQGAPPTQATSHIITVLAEVYNFRGVTCDIIFDFIRLLIDEFSELNAMLLLRIVRLSGHSLRSDDPLALGDIVRLVKTAVDKMDPSKVSVRLKFTVETIYDLKNNMMKTGHHQAEILSEHTSRMRKLLASIRARKLKASEPLKTTLKDIESWEEGDDEPGKSSQGVVETKHVGEDFDGLDYFDGNDEATPDLEAMARQHGMNNPLKRSIFVATVSAANEQEGFVKINKLRLNKRQEKEVPAIVLYCGAIENGHNPYYLQLLKRICTTHKMRWALQYQLWQVLKGMGETLFDAGADDEGDGSFGDMTEERQYGYAKMIGQLISEGVLKISILKSLVFWDLKPVTKRFLQVLLTTVLLECQKSKGTTAASKAIEQVFLAVDGMPQLASSLQTFLNKRIRKATIFHDAKNIRVVKAGCEVADRVLVAIQSGGGQEDEAVAE